MDTFEAIRTRRSVRRYEDRPVPEELVTKLLAAAMAAPSARNAQPWQFAVIDDRAMLAEIATINPNAQMAGRARWRSSFAAISAWSFRPAIGWSIVRRRSRTCCWPPTLPDWARCGRASIRARSGWTGCGGS